jgi:phage FluMu protein Com
MRPRDIINRRKNIYLVIVAISFGVFAVVAFAEKYLPEPLGKAISYGAGSVFLVGVLFVYFGIKCPKCNKTLGLNFVYAEEKLTHCPRCNVNFDEDSL